MSVPLVLAPRNVLWAVNFIYRWHLLNPVGYDHRKRTACVSCCNISPCLLPLDRLLLSHLIATSRLLNVSKSAVVNKNSRSCMPAPGTVPASHAMTVWWVKAAWLNTYRALQAATPTVDSHFPIPTTASAVFQAASHSVTYFKVCSKDSHTV